MNGRTAGRRPSPHAPPAHGGAADPIAITGQHRPVRPGSSTVHNGQTQQSAVTAGPSTAPTKGERPTDPHSQQTPSIEQRTPCCSPSNKPPNTSGPACGSSADSAGNDASPSSNSASTSGSTAPTSTPTSPPAVRGPSTARHDRPRSDLSVHCFRRVSAACQRCRPQW